MMKRGEAIKRIDEQYKICEEFYYLSASPEKDYPGVMSYMEALAVAISALRPVSRERVEKVWPGCPYCKEDGDGYVKKFGAYSILDGEVTTGHCKPQKIKFCPHCSRPLTDEAVEMVMGRMEALYETTE